MTQLIVRSKEKRELPLWRPQNSKMLELRPRICCNSKDIRIRHRTDSPYLGARVDNWGILFSLNGSLLALILILLYTCMSRCIIWASIWTTTSDSNLVSNRSNLLGCCTNLIYLKEVLPGWPLVSALVASICCDM